MKSRFLPTAGRRLAVAVVAIPLVTVGCAGRSDDHGVAAATRSPIAGVTYSSDRRLPANSASDLATYADLVATITVVSEQKIPATDEEIERGEGLIGRRVTVSIDHVYWKLNPKAPPPSQLTFDVAGWALRDGKEYPMLAESGLRVQKGRTYIAPLVQFAPNDWGYISDDLVFPVVGGEISPDPKSQNVPQDFANLNGAPVTAYGKIVASATPDPDAAEFMNLPAEARFDAVVDKKKEESD